MVNRNEIEQVKNQVVATIKEAVDKICKVRISEEKSAFIDEVLAKKRSYVSTCEGLECIFVPCLDLGEINFGDLLKKYEDLRGCLISDLRYLIDASRKGEWFPGDPYPFRQEKTGKKVTLPNNDSASYTISALLHARELFKGEGIVDDIEETIERGVHYILERFVGKGWAWNEEKERNPNLYYTWSILESLDDLRTYDMANRTATHRLLRPKDYEDLRGRIAATRQWLETTLLEEKKAYLFGEKRSYSLDSWDSQIRRLHSEITQGGSILVQVAYYLVEALCSLLLSQSRKRSLVAKSVGKYVLDNAETISEYIIAEARYPAKKSYYISDGSLIPLLLRTISFIFRSCGDIKFLAEKYGQLPKVLKDFFDRVVDEKIGYRKSKYIGLWPRYPNEKYEIYYTERVIEALVSFYDYLKSLGNKKSEEEQPPPEGENKKLPPGSLNTLRTKASSVPLQVFPRYRNMFKKNRNLLRDFFILGVLHFLPDLYPFIDSILDLGVKPHNIFLLRKNYNYQHGEVIAKDLEDVTINVFRATLESEVEKVKREILSKAIEMCTKQSKKFIIIEDGAYFFPILYTDDEFMAHVNYCHGVVEQTTRGIEIDEKIAKEKNVKVAVVNVAKSLLKDIIEAPGVGQQVLDNLKMCIANYERFDALRVLVVGGGKIGSRIAEAVAGVPVTKVDLLDKKPLMIEKPKGVTILKPEVALSTVIQNYDLVISSTGKPSIDEKSILAVNHTTWLASASSERMEIDISALERNLRDSEEKSIKPVGEWITDYELLNATIRLIAGGFPLNFILSEGVKNPYIDPILTELYLGTIVVASRSLELTTIGGNRIPWKLPSRGIANIPQEIEEDILDVYNRKYGVYGR